MFAFSEGEKQTAVSTLDKYSLFLLEHWRTSYAMTLKKEEKERGKGERKKREERKGG